MHDRFRGLKSLFAAVFPKAELPADNDVEIVTELDPLRDGSVYNSNVKALYKKIRRVAVPDVFLRWGDLIIIIEAKFFTEPTVDELSEQIRLQKQAVEHVLPYTKYTVGERNIAYAILTVKGIEYAGKDILSLTWDDIVTIAEEGDSTAPDYRYMLNVLKHALERARAELKREEAITYKKYSLSDLLEKVPELIKNGAVYVGITGGMDELQKLSMEQLQKRSHYKVSDTQWSDNWITLDHLLHRYIELQGGENIDFSEVR
jgi:hypothetical protein